MKWVNLEYISSRINLLWLGSLQISKWTNLRISKENITFNIICLEILTWYLIVFYPTHSKIVCIFAEVIWYERVSQESLLNDELGVSPMTHQFNSYTFGMTHFISKQHT